MACHSTLYNASLVPLLGMRDCLPERRRKYTILMISEGKQQVEECLSHERREGDYRVATLMCDISMTLRRYSTSNVFEENLCNGLIVLMGDAGLEPATSAM